MSNPTVSWLLLTYNRAEKVQASLIWNAANAGYDWGELVWVDNGSTDGVRSVVEPIATKKHLYNENTGVARGYNKAISMAECDYLVITGCDMLMPKNWLKTMIDYVSKIPQTGVACIYYDTLKNLPERARKGSGPGDWVREEINGLPVIHAMPMGRRIWARRHIPIFGYLQEGFGKYGYEDLTWAFHAEKACDEHGLIYYVIPDIKATHLGTEAVYNYDGKDDKEYYEFKRKELENPESKRLMAESFRDGFKFFDKPKDL